MSEDEIRTVADVKAILAKTWADPDDVSRLAFALETAWAERDEAREAGRVATKTSLLAVEAQKRAEAEIEQLMKGTGVLVAQHIAEENRIAIERDTLAAEVARLTRIVEALGPDVMPRIVHGCSACGQDHPIYFVRLAGPDGEWTHKGLCPAEGVTVLMRLDPAPDLTLRDGVEQMHDPQTSESPEERIGTAEGTIKFLKHVNGKLLTQKSAAEALDLSLRGKLAEAEDHVRHVDEVCAGWKAREELRDAELAQADAKWEREWSAQRERAERAEAEVKRLTEALEFTTFNADDNSERLIARIVQLETAVKDAKGAIDDSLWALKQSVYGKSIAVERLTEGLVALAALDQGAKG